MEKNVCRQVRPRRTARGIVAKKKNGKADISTLQKSGHFYLALTEFVNWNVLSARYAFKRLSDLPDYFVLSS
uniref:Uncharacterized protein n=1 Tax=mine drainage metagenome TaxID=410659 RepID=E6QW48_9ZZZZ